MSEELCSASGLPLEPPPEEWSPVTESRDEAEEPLPKKLRPAPLEEHGHSSVPAVAGLNSPVAARPSAS